jgi:hypothetical protein
LYGISLEEEVGINRHIEHIKREEVRMNATDVNTEPVGGKEFQLGKVLLQYQNKKVVQAFISKMNFAIQGNRLRVPWQG